MATLRTCGSLVVIAAFLFVVLAGSAERGSLLGTIRDAESGNPIAGASLTFVDPATGDTLLSGIVSGADGRYEAALSVGLALEAPTHFALLVGQPYPNPLTAGTPLTVPISGVAAVAEVTTSVYDALGRSIRDGSTLAPGTYFVAVGTAHNPLAQARSFTVAERTPLRLELAETRSLDQPDVRQDARKREGRDEVTVLVSASEYVPSVETIRLDQSGGGTADFKLGRVSTRVVLASETSVGSASVDREAVRLVIDAPGFILDGFDLSLPESAFTDPRTISVSYAPVLSHDLNSNFRPASVAVRIDTGGGYADSVMTLTLPASIPADEFPVVALFDEGTGEVEVLPLARYTTDRVTVVSRHFQRLSSTRNAGKKGSSYRFPAHLIVFSIQKSVLEAQAQLTSGFEPGTDSFEFVNMGSILSSGGHCAGQSLAAMWYYYEQRLKGAPGLFGLLDPTVGTSFVTDDGYEKSPDWRGYRWATVLQKRLYGYSTEQAAYRKLPSYPDLDRATWSTFVAAFLLTGGPQYVSVARWIGDRLGGHAIIAYGVDVTTRELLVADPNYPEQRRRIKFDGALFSPYSTRQNGADETNGYTNIRFFAKSALLDWESISSTWLAVMDGTIGSEPPVVFPQARIQARVNGDWTDWSEGLTIEDPTLELRVTCAVCPFGTLSGSGAAGATAFSDTGSRIADNGFVATDLSESVTVPAYHGPDGVYLASYAWKSNRRDTTRYIGEWIDFTRLTWNIPSTGSNTVSVRRTWTVDPFYIGGLTWQSAGSIHTSIAGSAPVGVRTGTMPDGELGIAGLFGQALDAQTLQFALVPDSASPTVMETTDQWGDRVRYTISAPRIAEQNEWWVNSDADDVVSSEGSVTFSYEFYFVNDGWNYGIPIVIDILEETLRADGSVLHTTTSTREIEEIYLFGVEQTTPIPF